MPMIYQPDQLEIQPYLDRAKQRDPNTEAITNRAAPLLRNTCFYYVEQRDYTGWKCYSSQTNDPKKAYKVNGSCSCPAYTTKTNSKTDNSTFFANNQHWCKHKIGLQIYLAILSEHLNKRTIGELGNFMQSPISNQARLHPQAYIGIIRDGMNPMQAAAFRFSNDHIPSVICDIRQGITSTGQPTYRFLTHQDASRFAGWLHRAFPLPLTAEQNKQDIYHEMRSAGFTEAMAKLAAEATHCTDENQLHFLWTTKGWDNIQSYWSSAATNPTPFQYA